MQSTRKRFWLASILFHNLGRGLFADYTASSGLVAPPASCWALELPSSTPTMTAGST